MYSLTLSVHQVLDLWHLSGSVHEHDGMGRVTTVATFSQDVITSDAFPDEDEVTNILRVVRQWADQTIRA